MELSALFETAMTSVVGFVSQIVPSTGIIPPDFPPIIGTGFLVHSDGIIATNRHVVECFKQMPRDPETGKLAIAPILFLRGIDKSKWEMLVLEIAGFSALSEFTSSGRWYGQKTPDIAFVQLKVRDVPSLKLATGEHYLKVGQEVATIGYPMGDQPLTALGKLHQLSPMLRRGIVSSIFPTPFATPHGFTIDIMQQGGSSGSPIFRTDTGEVVGMMASSVIEWGVAESAQIKMHYSQNTNISIAEPSHVIQLALSNFVSQKPARDLPNFGEWRANQIPNEKEGLKWKPIDPTVKSE